MGKKRQSLPTGMPIDYGEKIKKDKGKKRRRESDSGVLETTAGGGDADTRSPSGGNRPGSSKAAVLRRAPEDAVSPILVSFANQMIPMDMESLQFALHEADDEDRKGERVVIGEGSRVDYWGLNFNTGSESHDLCRYMIGVEDKETGEITLHEAGHAYALQQSVVGRVDSVEDHAMQGLDWKQRRDALVNQFGSKKKQAAIRARDANVIEADAVVGGGALSRVLGRVLKEVDGNDEMDGAGNTTTDGAAASVEEARRRFLPLMRPEAPTPEGVYSASDIAGAQELQALGRHIDSLAKECEGGLQQWAKEFAEQPKGSCPQFVSRRITLLPDLSNPNQRRRLLQLLYLRHMCKFHLARDFLKGTPSELSNSLDIPEVVLRRLLEKFTVPESADQKGIKAYHRSKTLKGQLLVHTLCLALVLEGCRVDFGVLSQDLKLSESETRALFRELGCKTDKTMAQLKLPLVFPRSRSARKN